MERLTERIEGNYIARQDKVNGKIIGNQQCLNKLGQLEDAEEKGLLLRLPCKVGDTLYTINEEMRRIHKVVAINRMTFLLGEIHIYCDGSSYSDLICCDDIGKTVFLTREAAEQALNDAKKGVERK